MKPMIVALAVLLGCACKGKDSSVSDATKPAWYPVPSGAKVQSAMKVGDRDTVVYVFAKRDVEEVGGELRGKLKGVGTVTEGPGSTPRKQFISVIKDGILVDATVFSLEHTTLTLSIGAAPPAPAPAPTAAAPAVAPTPGAPAGYPPGFPFIAGGTKDPGYTDGLLLVYPDASAMPLAADLRRDAEKAGWQCTSDTDRGAVRPPVAVECTKDSWKTVIRARAVEHPKGGTALFVGSAPGLP